MYIVLDSSMATVPIQIVRFVDEHQPGWVECLMSDAEGIEHRFIEKAPVVTGKILSAASAYPQAGVIACEVIAQWSDVNGRAVSRVTTRRPWGIKSVAGASEFVVSSELVRP